jgi:hypothetical protein
VRAQELGDGEDVLAMRHRGQHRLLDPLAKDQHPLLVAGRAEAAGLAGERQQVLVATLVAVDPGEALVEVAAVEKAIQGLVLDAPVDVPLPNSGCPILSFFPYGPAIHGANGELTTPALQVNVGPDTQDMAEDMLRVFIDQGWFEAGGGYVVFWPPAAIGFEWEDVDSA